jgi:tetratricopeptide (TPR) repeat protein
MAAVARDPVSQEMFARALALHQQGQAAEAEPLYRAVLAAIPDDHQAANNLGFLLYDTGRPEEALGFFDTAIALGVAPGPREAGPARSLMTLSRFARPSRCWREAIAAVAGRGRAAAWRGLYADGPGPVGGGLAALRQPIVPDTAKQVARRFPAPEWRGEPLAGKRLFVWREQGYWRPADAGPVPCRCWTRLEDHLCGASRRWSACSGRCPSTTCR